MINGMTCFVLTQHRRHSIGLERSAAPNSSTCEFKCWFDELLMIISLVARWSNRKMTFRMDWDGLTGSWHYGFCLRGSSFISSSLKEWKVPVKLLTVRTPSNHMIVLELIWVVLALFPYIVLFILLGRASTLEGAWDGIKFFITPDFKRILEPQVWRIFTSTWILHFLVLFS